MFDFLLAGFTDVWSAVRKKSSARLADVLEGIPLAVVAEFFERLVAVCQDVTSPWQAKEGVLLAMTVIIRKFAWTGSNWSRPAHHQQSTQTSGVDSNSKMQSPASPMGRCQSALGSDVFADTRKSADASEALYRPQPIGRSASEEDTSTSDARGMRARSNSVDFRHQSPTRYRSGQSTLRISYGGLSLDSLPPFLTTGLRGVVFAMLAHRQLSIREAATKAFAAYLTRSRFRDALSALKDIVLRLRAGDVPTQSAPPTHPVGHTPHLHAYEAEGLLRVCIFIIKHVPPGFLLPNWPLYFSTFEMYLTHPASTVRQATSEVFRYLVAKDSSNPTMLKLVLQGLAADWEVDVNCLCHHADDTSRDSNVTRTRRPLPDVTECTKAGEMSSRSWQWREGRLLAYELILKFLLVNQAHYVFPSTLLLGRQHRQPADAMTEETNGLMGNGAMFSAGGRYVLKWMNVVDWQCRDDVLRHCVVVEWCGMEQR